MPGKRTRKSEAGREGFLYRLVIPNMEREGLESLVVRREDTAQTARNWAITIWTGSPEIAPGQPDYGKFIPVTAAVQYHRPDEYWKFASRRKTFLFPEVASFYAARLPLAS